MEKLVLEKETETVVEAETKTEETKTQQIETERKLPKITIKKITPLPEEVVSSKTEYLN